MDIFESQHIGVAIAGGSERCISIVDVDALKLIYLVILLHEANILEGT